jgi:hypothetical protein
MLLALLLLAASEHLLEEVELGLGDGYEEKKSPEGLAPALQHDLKVTPTSVE